MQITLRYFDGCPNWTVAKERLQEALSAMDQHPDVALELVSTPEEAERVGFKGSPTILVDGEDPFDAGGEVGLTCRVYRTEAGLEGAPSVLQLREALRQPR